jgi:hypothetical protein
MGAPKGNQFWKLRSKHGPNRLFESADLLWEACEEYFEWVEANPLWENKVAQFQGAPVDMPAAKMRAMTIGGLCLYLGIDRTTWGEWKSNKDLSHVVTRAEETIYLQKLTGAAADLLNPNIIARELGLRDATDVKHSGAVGLTDLSDAELARRLAELEQARANSER